MQTDIERKLSEGARDLELRTYETLTDAEWPVARIDKIMGAWESGHNRDTVHFTTVNGKALTAFLRREENPERAIVEEVTPGWL